ncbi:MAG: thioether cross-link-forming SCIFF peptide maturase, partial [Oscillospiraceae bacterium]|nr:thioether cross-link-forming SCIFF peptide maturase [Oscillospiraceae bacterium]
DFFGGEPLLNWEVVKDIVDYARSVEQGSGKKFRFTLTTNGLLIDGDVISFANREMHNVVLSLDGRPEVNDRHRRLPDDAGGTYETVLPKLREMVEARRGKGYYIRGTFTRQNLDFASDVLHIADLGFKEISLEPAIAKPGSPMGFTNGDLPELFRQYEILAIEMLRRSRLGRGFSFYHFNLDLEGGPCVHKRIAGCGVGTEYLAVTPSGKLYPCHQFVGDEGFALGDVCSGIVNTKLRSEFGKWDIYTRTKCRDCWARMYCSGGCAANAHNDSGSIGGVYALGCELFKKRLECAIMMKVAIS